MKYFFLFIFFFLQSSINMKINVVREIITYSHKRGMLDAKKLQARDEKLKGYVRNKLGLFDVHFLYSFHYGRE